MPIYEYRCQDCQTAFEKLVRHASEAEQMVCPECGKTHVLRQLSTFAAHSGGAREKAPAMCPNGGVCHTPGACGMN